MSDKVFAFYDELFIKIFKFSSPHLKILFYIIYKFRLD